MGSECIECGSFATRLEHDEDGHFRKTCEDCGYVGGPYVSNQNASAPATDAENRAPAAEDEKPADSTPNQRSLTDF